MRAKLSLAAVCVMGLCLLCACGKGVTLSLFQETLSTTGASFILLNETDVEYSYADEFLIQVFEDGEWKDFYSRAGEGGEAALPPYSQAEIQARWQGADNMRLPEGKYRLIISVALEDESNYRLSADLEITGDTPEKVYNYVEDGDIVSIEGVSLAIIPKTLTKHGAEFLLENGRERQSCDYSDFYMVQAYLNQRWIDVSRLPPMEDALTSVAAGSSDSFSVRWDVSYDDGLPPGRYRLLREVWLVPSEGSGWNDRSGPYHIAAEFEISD